MNEENKTVETSVQAPANEYEMRKYLNQLSKEIYGTSSKWQKLVDKGLLVPVNPANNPESNVTHTTVRLSLFDVYNHLTGVKKERQARLEARLATRVAAEARRDLENALTGSALA